MQRQSPTVAEALRSQFDDLTRAERQLADTLLSHYPAAGLASITALAKQAQVSTPTVARLVRKLGYSGYPGFQASLRDELDATVSSPIKKHDHWAEGAPDAHILNRFADSAITNLRTTLDRLDTRSFDEVARLVADTDRKVFVVGGRITSSLATYFYTHLQVIRDGVALAGSEAGSWPHHFLNMSSGDVLVLFDIRRYENNLLRLAEMACERGVSIVLLTDQWGSPVSKYATHVINCRVEAPSAWDSSMVTMFIVEALIAAVEELLWDTTKARIRVLEDLFDRTRLLKRFI